MSLYTDLKDAGCEMGNHESDHERHDPPDHRTDQGLPLKKPFEKRGSQSSHLPA